MGPYKQCRHDNRCLFMQTDQTYREFCRSRMLMILSLFHWQTRSLGPSNEYNLITYCMFTSWNQIESYQSAKMKKDNPKNNQPVPNVEVGFIRVFNQKWLKTHFYKLPICAAVCQDIFLSFLEYRFLSQNKSYFEIRLGICTVEYFWVRRVSLQCVSSTNGRVPSDLCIYSYITTASDT